MKIFLSSTYEDLVDHRARAAQAVERLGQHGICMEVFGARPGEATVMCLIEIDSSDQQFLQWVNINQREVLRRLHLELQTELMNS